MNETNLEELESQLPAAADSVFSDAYEQAIRMGLSVVVAIDAQVIEVFPDGSKSTLKRSSRPLTLSRAKRIGRKHAQKRTSNRAPWHLFECG